MRRTGLQGCAAAPRWRVSALFPALLLARETSWCMRIPVKARGDSSATASTIRRRTSLPRGGSHGRRLDDVKVADVPRPVMVCRLQPAPLLDVCRPAQEVWEGLRSVEPSFLPTPCRVGVLGSSVAFVIVGEIPQHSGKAPVRGG